MDEIERAELEAEQAAREDYLREAYGSEAAMLVEIDNDHAEYLREVWLASMTPEERAEHDAKLAEANARLEEAESHGIDMDDDVPF